MLKYRDEQRVVGEVLRTTVNDSGDRVCLTSYGSSVVLKNIVVPVPITELETVGVLTEPGSCFKALVNVAAYEAPEVQPSDFAALPDYRGLWGTAPYDDVMFDIL